MSCFVHNSVKFSSATLTGIGHSSFTCPRRSKDRAHANSISKNNSNSNHQRYNVKFITAVLEDIPTSNIKSENETPTEENSSLHTDTEVETSESEGVADKQAEEDVEEDSENPSPTILSTDDDWYEVSKPLAQPDTGSVPFYSHDSSVTGSNEPVLDILSLEAAGRKVLEKGSYDNVIDVNVEEGGKLEEDEDNNEIFSGVGLEALIDSETLQKNLKNELGIETATHVQLAAIPRIQQGKDIVIQSYTGTGKTLAFLLPILDAFENIDVKDDDDAVKDAVKNDHIKVMIVAPTRELAMQITKECEKLIVNTNIRCQAIIGGANPIRQIEKLKKQLPNIVIGTPGRLVELIENKGLRKSYIDTFVIDEIDQCLSKQFSEQIQKLLTTLLPKDCQKIFVSATGDVDIVRKFASTITSPSLLRVGGKLRVPKNIEHWMCIVPSRLKLDTIRKILHIQQPAVDRAIVFVDDPRKVSIIGERLWQMKIPVGTLSGSADKVERKEVLTAFRKGKISVLVCTEVAARGLDVREISHVINYDLPTDGDHYVHRAGRCGRVGRKGYVVNIAASEHAFVMTKLSKEIGIEIERMEPRNGIYSKPIVRENRLPQREKKNKDDGDKNTKKIEKAKNEKSIRKESNETSTKNKGKRMKTKIDDIQKAVNENDEEYLINQLVDGDDGEEEYYDEDDEAFEEGKSGEVSEKKPMKRWRVKQLEAKKNKAEKNKADKNRADKNRADKNKVEKNNREKRQKVEFSQEEEVAMEEKRQKSSAHRKIRKNPAKRAVSEGWVGNRAKDN